MALHRALRNKPDRQLYLDDIEGSRPHPRTFKTSRVVNPLVPEYRLPSVVVAPPLQPKFIRDSIDNSDIEGVTPKPLYAQKVS